jgi:hypothetical protein
MTGDPQSNSQEGAFVISGIKRQRFFFDTQDDGKSVTDTEGLELDGIEAARSEAIRALPDMARDALPDGDQRSFVVCVRDESGQTLLLATHSLTVQRMV